MISKGLSESAVEINCIFDNMSAETLNKIPNDFITFIRQISSKTYSFKYDKRKPLKEQQLLPETEGLIALIYRDYLCNENERKEYIEHCNKVLEKIEEEKREKFNPDNIFEKKESVQHDGKIVPIMYKKESFFKKIINKIKSFFKK